MPVDVPRYDGRGILPIDVFFSFFEFTNSTAARWGGGYVPRAASACSAFSARRVIEASAPSAASARRSAVSKAAGDADAERPDDEPDDDPGEPDRDRARSKLSQPPDGSESVSLDLDRDRSEPREPETETARCSIEGDDRADQCSALASPCTESQCVGSLS